VDGVDVVDVMDDMRSILKSGCPSDGHAHALYGEMNEILSDFLVPTKNLKSIDALSIFNAMHFEVKPRFHPIYVFSKKNPQFCISHKMLTSFSMRVL